MNIDLTPVLQAIIALLAAIVTYKIVPWIKSRTDAQQQANIQAMVRIGVYAAEQIYGAGKGAQKMEHVKKWLESQGFTVDIEAIEAAVGEMNHDLITIETEAAIEDGTTASDGQSDAE